MPDWNEILKETTAGGSPQDIVRRKYLKQLYEKTGRNVIIYYSGWLQKQNIPGLNINDSDKIGLMTTIHDLDRSKGLDLILHTPGGETAATESIVDYLRQMFGTDIRAIVPQIAMSGGTMISCACKSIMMGKQSSLGPVDPQFMGLPAHGIIEEFEQAKKEIRVDPSRIPVWQPIIARYNPTLLGECQKSIAWSTEMVKDWLLSGMLKDNPNKNVAVQKILDELGNHSLTKSHARHLSMAKCKEIGLTIEDMEDDNNLQDLILSVHHACMITFSSTPATKIIENHEGRAYVNVANSIIKKDEE